MKRDIPSRKRNPRKNPLLNRARSAAYHGRVKLATWNVNSIRARLPHVLDWLSANQPDVLCIQETKVTDAEFPYLPVQAAGYHAIHNGQKAYNGVATLTRVPVTGVAPT